MITADRAATRSRIAKLRRYVEKNLLTETDFVCSHQADCRHSCRPGDSFREGTMSHVGRHFDLRADGKPLRIVVVGQESGFPKGAPALQSHVTLDARYQQVHDVTGLEKRYYTTNTHKGRNPHMRGTTTALRILMGTDAGTDREGEFVKPGNDKPFHIFDGFALVNRLLCSAAPPGSSNGRPTGTMFRNCSEHFSATMKILEPTIVIIQGRAVAKWVKPLLVPGRTYDDHHHEAFLGKHRMIVCTFTHPSAHGAHRWGDQPTARYIADVVRPTLRKALIQS
ncbi:MULTISPECIES: hypothetical protein [unclassified Mycobacterium]|uniref:hypothetical protein n=1 Tax=unclassified Mycobacterium TaxID=2642494 RepID=UPI0006DCF903|nr:MULTISPECIES: hypothetical protein [unclassified Mycobacterium]